MTLDGLLVAFVLVGLAVAFLAWKVGEQ